MARLLQCGFEQNSVTAGIDVDTLTTPGNFSADSTIFRSGAYSLFCNASASVPKVDWTPYSSNQTIIGYARCYLYVSSGPSVVCEVLGFRNAAGTNVARVVLSSDAATLSLQKQDATTIGSVTMPQALTGRWTRIELLDDATGAGALEMRLTDCGPSGADMGQAYDFTVSGANSAAGSWTGIRLGAFVNATTAQLYYDDVALNDTTGSFQTSWCGSGRIIHLRPNAAGDAAAWTPTSGANFSNVDEFPPDGNTTKCTSSTLSQEDLHNCDDSGLRESAVINVVAIGAQYHDETAADATAAFKLEVEKVGSGTKSQSAGIIPNSTNYFVNNGNAGSCANYFLFTYQDPDSAAWKASTLDSMQIGYIISAVNVRSISVSAAWASVDYTLVGEPTNLRLMGVGV